MRASDDPFWQVLRTRLRERGIDPDTTDLLDSLEDDVDFEFGIIETADGRRFQYGLVYSEQAPQDAHFVEWRLIRDAP